MYIDFCTTLHDILFSCIKFANHLENVAAQSSPRFRFSDRAERHDLITIFAIHSPFLLPSFCRWDEKRGKE